MSYNPNVPPLLAAGMSLLTVSYNLRNIYITTKSSNEAKMKRFLHLRPKMPNPIIMLIGSFIIMAWGVTLEKSINSRRGDVRNARTAYMKSLTNTRTQLSGTISKVTSDTTLKQNMRWKLSNSVKRRLKISVQQGVVDQIHIWNSSCKLLASANLMNALPSNCPKSEKGNFITDRFVWTTIKDAPVLTVVKKLVSGRKSYYVMGMVQIDQNWLNLQGDLKKIYAKLDLTISNENAVSGAIVIREGRNASGNSIATLGTQEFMDKFFGGNFLSAEPFKNPFFWPTWILSAFFITMIWLQNKKWREDTAFKQRELIEWCKSLSPIANVIVKGKKVEEDGLDLRLAQKYVSQAIQTKNDAMRGATRKRGALEGTINDLELEIQSFQKRLAELAELDSLAIQLQRTTGSFLDKMELLHSRSEDLSDVLDSSVAVNSQTLSGILAEWERGISERGTRKFIRGLGETEGANGFETLLEEQINTIIELSENIHDGSINASMNSNELVEYTCYASRIASLWHGLALSTDEENHLEVLTESLEESQEMVQLEKDLDSVDFRNLLKETDIAQLPKVPKTIWVSALYHIYLGMAERIKDKSGFCIVSRLRTESTRNIIAISLIHPNRNTDYPEQDEKQAYHLEVAKAMLTPYNVKLNILQTLSGPFPIALTWDGDALLDAGEEIKLLPDTPNTDSTSIDLA
jgi:hypothetical protein